MDFSTLLIAAGGLVVGALLAAAVLPALRRRSAAASATPADRPLPMPGNGGATAAAATATSAVDGGAAPDPDAQRQALAEERAALERGVERANRAERLRNLLLAKMSHDIRTPLNSVITLSQLLVEGNAGPLGVEQRQYMEIVLRNGEALLALVNTILDLANLEAGRLEVDLQAVDMRTVLESAAGGARRHAHTKGLAFHLNLPRHALLARADEERLRQVLAGLLSASVVATSHGYVEASAEGVDDHVAIRVTDTGAGPPDETRGRDLDELLANIGAGALHPDRAASELTLILASRLTALMGGTLTVDGAPGEGTTYSITLPIADASGADAADATASADTGRVAEASEALSRSSTQAVELHGVALVIEDDEVERRRLVQLMKETGLEVATAASGRDGLDLLAAQPRRFDVVVLDLVMPGMTGLDVLRAARADQRLERLPFVVVSALYMTKSERDVLGPGVIAVVRKGEASGAELAQGLRRALESRRQSGRGRAAAAAGDGAAGGEDGGRGSGGPGNDRDGDRDDDGGAGYTRDVPSERSRSRVLIVDDNADNLFSIRQILAPLPLAVETARTGGEAIEACRRQRPDLVLMDVELPGLSGLETTRIIHQLPGCADVPVIALTAEAMRGDRERALEECNSYLAKPVEPTQVVEAVTRALHIPMH
jgi:two-component system sensor histidine kinase/response regulator